MRQSRADANRVMWISGKAGDAGRQEKKRKLEDCFKASPGNLGRFWLKAKPKRGPQRCSSVA